MILILTLPPSVNRMFVATARTKFIHTKDYTDYLERTAWEVKAWCLKNNIIPIKWYTYLDIDWYLKDVRSDAHNMEKALFDALERGGLFSNDRYIMNRTQKIKIDRNDPRVEMKITTPVFEKRYV